MSRSKKKSLGFVVVNTKTGLRLDPTVFKTRAKARECALALEILAGAQLDRLGRVLEPKVWSGVQHLEEYVPA